MGTTKGSITQIDLYDIIKMPKVNPLHKQGDLFYTDANVNEVWCSKKDVQLKMS